MLITMKLTTKSFSGIFKKVPKFLQRSTDRLQLDSGGSLPTFSRMINHHTGFRSLFSLFRVRGLRGWSVWFFYDFRTCRVGHLECVYLIPHFSNLSSKFCNIDCLTLHPPWAIVCHPRQTRVEVHVLVVIIQGYCFINRPLQEPKQKLLPEKKLLPKNIWFLPA